MIEQESEKIVYGSLITSTKCYNCIHFPLCFAQKGGVNLGLTSENDCCYYQSKLPKDSVVLSREEYERITKELVTEQRATEIAKEYFEKIRKETADKIFEVLYQWLDLENIEKYGFVTIQKFDFLRKFREIYKQFGLEIKE